MNAGKSTSLLQSNYNYNERGMNTLLLAPSVDTRYGAKKITSRIGLQADATAFSPDEEQGAVQFRDESLLPLGFSNRLFGGKPLPV